MQRTQFGTLTVFRQKPVYIIPDEVKSPPLGILGVSHLPNMPWIFDIDGWCLLMVDSRARHLAANIQWILNNGISYFSLYILSILITMHYYGRFNLQIQSRRNSTKELQSELCTKLSLNILSYIHLNIRWEIINSLWGMKSISRNRMLIESWCPGIYFMLPIVNRIC